MSPVNILAGVAVIFLILGIVIYVTHKHNRKSHVIGHDKIDRNYAKLHYIEIEHLENIRDRVNDLHNKLVNKQD